MKTSPCMIRYEKLPRWSFKIRFDQNSARGASDQMFHGTLCLGCNNLPCNDNCLDFFKISSMLPWNFYITLRYPIWLLTQNLSPISFEAVSKIFILYFIDRKKIKKYSFPRQTINLWSLWKALDFIRKFKS